MADQPTLGVEERATSPTLCPIAKRACNPASTSCELRLMDLQVQALRALERRHQLGFGEPIHGSVRLTGLAYGSPHAQPFLVRPNLTMTNRLVGGPSSSARPGCLVKVARIRCTSVATCSDPGTKGKESVPPLTETKRPSSAAVQAPRPHVGRNHDPRVFAADVDDQHQGGVDRLEGRGVAYADNPAPIENPSGFSFMVRSRIEVDACPRPCVRQCVSQPRFQTRAAGANANRCNIHSARHMGKNQSAADTLLRQWHLLRSIPRHPRRIGARICAVFWRSAGYQRHCREPCNAT